MSSSASSNFIWKSAVKKTKNIQKEIDNAFHVGKNVAIYPSSAHILQLTVRNPGPSKSIQYRIPKRHTVHYTEHYTGHYTIQKYHYSNITVIVHYNT
ncbi:hypothetical protein Glove_345g56 [Diversispora epigaea]|uniref:Uncharacterized protein n=1 Tax=Diversispora epigaea TaxID=1348612 RepID=A0A397HJX5_9GLOM|nr:hypothetical protein Glove_345g56 [Diversispora epigaea]